MTGGRSPSSLAHAARGGHPDAAVEVEPPVAGRQRVLQAPAGEVDESRPPRRLAGPGRLVGQAPPIADGAPVRPQVTQRTILGAAVVGPGGHELAALLVADVAGDLGE